MDPASSRDSGTPLRKGVTEPRLFTQPLRPLTRATTDGYAVIDFARAIGQPLNPWQEWFVIHALEKNPDGTYRFRVVLLLVARQNGKTHVGKIIKLWKLFVGGARLILGVGQDINLAKEVWSAAVETIRDDPDLAAELGSVRTANGDVQFTLANGSRYKITAANRSAGRGLSVDQLDFEELREQRDWQAWSALSKTIAARRKGQIFCFSNAGDDESVVLNQLRDAALADRDDSVGLFEWSAPDNCDLDDWSAIAQANPALGYLEGLDTSIRSALGTDPPAVYRTEVLCQRVDQVDGAFDLAAWKDSRDSRGSLAGSRDRIIACVDVAPDSAHVALYGAAVQADNRVRVQPFGAWKSTDEARFELPKILSLVGPAAVTWFPSGPAAALAPLFRKADQPWEVLEIKGSQVAEACQVFTDLVTARRIIHPGDPLLDAHVAGAKKLQQGDGWRYVRRGVGHVNAVYAAAGATYIALTLPVAKPKNRLLVV